MPRKAVTYAFFLILSFNLSAKDIPSFQELVACTPAKGNTFDVVYWCYSDLEYTVAVRIQNWTQTSWKNVSIQMELPRFVEYIPDSTEYANKLNIIKGFLVAGEWLPFSDLSGGKFPLLNGAKIVDTLDPCSTDDYYCSNDILFLRFRIKVKSTTPKNEVFELKASIKSADCPEFFTNLGIPLTLKYSDAGCVENQEEVDLSACGGSVISENEDIDTETADEDTSETRSDGCTALFI